MAALGLDTSNYTTSAAVLCDGLVTARARLLDVPSGTLGLRQSDALFQHVGRLPGLLAELREAGALRGLTAVGASTRPRAVEGSYMPCFLAGESMARAIAAALNIPFSSFSHQQGHLAAAAFGAGCEALLDAPFLAWHLSGGTTELLHVRPDGRSVLAERVGGTSDLSAGQLIDRTGVRLGLAFPAGRALDALSQTSDRGKHFTVKTNDFTFSLSGVENQVMALADGGAAPEDIARFVFETIASVLARVTRAALARWPGLPVLCSGGVAGAALLRARLTTEFGAVFAPQEYSADNAIGIAVLTSRERG